MKEGTCALCGGTFTYCGHNPQPVLPSVGQRVCNQCNDDTVLPVRLGRLRLPWLQRIKLTTENAQIDTREPGAPCVD